MNTTPTRGEGLAALLTQRLGEERVVCFRFSRPSKSHLTYQWLSMINSGRLKMYQPDEAPTLIYEEAWKQLRLARYRIPWGEPRIQTNHSCTYLSFNDRLYRWDDAAKHSIPRGRHRDTH